MILDLRDSLVIRSISDLPGKEMIIIARFQSPEFSNKEINKKSLSKEDRRNRASAVCVQDAIFTHKPALAYANEFQRFRLGSVDLVGLTVINTGNALLPGQTFVEIGITRDDVNLDRYGSILISGYLKGQSGLSWPYGSFESPGDGPGFMDSITGSFPGAGSSVLFQMPAGRRGLIMEATVKLTTSSTVADRTVYIGTNPAANRAEVRTQAERTQPASTSREYFFSNIGANVPQNITFETVSMPNILLNPLETINVHAINLQGGDLFLVNKWRGLFWAMPR